MDCYSQGRVAKLVDFGISQMMVLTDKDNSWKTREIQTITHRSPEILVLDIEATFCRYEEFKSYTYGPDISLFLETGVMPFPYNSVYGPRKEYIDPAEKVLYSISLLLGSPSEEIIREYPFQEEGTGLSMVENLEARERIFAALNFDTKKRTLI